MSITFLLLKAHTIKTEWFLGEVRGVESRFTSSASTFTQLVYDPVIYLKRQFRQGIQQLWNFHRSNTASAANQNFGSASILIHDMS